MASKIINVANAAQLASAIASARGGETILLAPGNYGALTIKGRMLADTVTIKSADPLHDAVISDLRVNLSSGFRFEDIDLSRPLAKGEADFTQAAYISSSSNIQIVGMDFRGSMDGNAANDGTALRITGGQNISVTGSTFEQWRIAGLFSDVTGLTVSGNSVSGAVKSFDFATLQNAVVSGNRFDGVTADFNAASFAGKNVVFQNNVVTGVSVPPPVATTTHAAAAPVDIFAGGKTVTVSTTAELNLAIKAAKGGETILLAPGDYGAIAIKNKVMTGTVTIKSADGTHDAVFSDLRIDKSAGFAFNDIDVHRPLKAGEFDFTQAVYVSNSQRIDFVGSDFTGSLDNNCWNDGTALRVSDSTDVRVIDSTFEQWGQAAGFGHDTRLVVAGNTVTNVREGFNFAADDNVTIARNSFSNFKPNYAAGDHSDAIQFFNNGTDAGSNHVVIRDNVILQGANGGSQGIFIRAENLALKHTDFLIENNLYNGDARHGITLNGVDGATVRGNTVTTGIGGRLEAGINVSNSSAVLVDHNIAPLLLDSGANKTLVWRDNIDLYDTAGGKGVTLASIFAGTAAGTNVSAYALKAGGAAALAHAGFNMVDGIGAASFDLAHLSSYGQLAPMLALIA